MSAANSFTYKPALLKGAETITVEGTTVTGPDWSLDLSEVGQVAFVNQVMKRNRFLRLDLYLGDDRRSVGYTGPASAWTSDPDAQTHLAALAAILEALGRAQPGAEVAMGVIRGGRWGMFLVGLFSLLGGLGLGLAVLIAEVSSDRLIAVAIPLLFLIAMGGVVTYGNWPWRPRPRVPASVLAKTLGELVAKHKGPTDGTA